MEVGGDNDNGGNDDARSCNSVGSKGSRGKGPPRKAQRTGPSLPSVPAVPPTAQLVDWLLLQQAPSQWQQRAVVAEGEVLQLRGKLLDARQDAHWAQAAAKAAETERDQLRARKGRSKGPVQQQQ